MNEYKNVTFWKYFKGIFFKKLKMYEFFKI